MPRNSTLENFHLNKSQNISLKNHGIVSPDQLTIQNLLAYSKALSVLKSPYKIGKQQTSFRLILN
ncbi:MAG: hypothetical protein PF484_08100 [Bacteroidales bacterium]|jgi:hypothetical protein|nr:hypothetical protein [Bacteroidales bacterium]